jgi:hypothetical protein
VTEGAVYSDRSQASGATQPEAAAAPAAPAARPVTVVRVAALGYYIIMVILPAALSVPRPRLGLRFPCILKLGSRGSSIVDLLSTECQ